MKYSYYSIIIKKLFKGYLVRKLNKLKGPALMNRKCTNETDFLMFENIKEIPYEQFYSYKDLDGGEPAHGRCSEIEPKCLILISNLELMLKPAATAGFSSSVVYCTIGLQNVLEHWWYVQKTDV